MKPGRDKVSGCRHRIAPSRGCPPAGSCCARSPANGPPFGVPPKFPHPAASSGVPIQAGTKTAVWPVSDLMLVDYPRSFRTAITAYD